MNKFLHRAGLVCVSLFSFLSVTFAMRPQIEQGRVVGAKVRLTNQQLTGFPLNGRGFYQLAQLTARCVIAGSNGELSVLSFGAEFFNIANITSFSAPGASITTSAATATATVDTSTGVRITSTSVPSRDIQFALKYNF
jgi:hypothetical protein